VLKLFALFSYPKFIFLRLCAELSSLGFDSKLD
jgi:hypothetical protein